MDKIDLEHWKKLDLRVGKIKSIKEHPNAEKLYILLVDLGKGEHDLQIVAGLKPKYKESDLINKKIVVIRNLKSATIRGIESQGMLLAAVFKDKIAIISPDQDIDTGSKVL